MYEDPSFGGLELTLNKMLEADPEFGRLFQKPIFTQFLNLFKFLFFFSNSYGLLSSNWFTTGHW